MLGLRRQGRPALARPRPHPAPAVGIHEAGDRARARPLLRAAAGRRNRAAGARIWPAIALLGVPAALILVQPDLGTCIMVVAVRGDGHVPRRACRCGSSSRRWSAIAVAAPIAYQHRSTAISASASTPSSTPKATRSAPAITSPSRRSRSARAACGARASSTAARATSIICPRATPTSSSPRMAEEWGLVGGLLLILAFGAVIRWGMRVSVERAHPLRPARRGGPDGDDLLLRRRST